MRLFNTLLFLFVLLPVIATASSNRRIEATYVAVVESIPADTSQLEVWVPLPADTPHQSITALNVESPYPTVLRHDPEYGNAYLYLKIAKPETTEITIKVHFQTERREILNPNLIAVRNWNPTPEAFSRFLKPERLVTLSPRIFDLAEKVTGGLTTNEAKARAIYDYVLGNVTYDKTVPGWGRGDTERVCDVRKGNCTDFHSLFISLARASRIPARFVMGFPILQTSKGTILGYHCWAEFYLAGHGWVPVDPSEASKSKDIDRRNYLFGNLDPDRIQFTVGRDIKLDPPQTAEPLNYFIFPYVEADGKPVSTTKIQLDYTNLPDSTVAKN